MSTDDKWLHELRRFEPASPDLANRIVLAAHPRAQRITLIAYLRELLASALPQPAFALAGVLTVGVVIGLNLPTPLPADNHDVILQAYSEEGTIL